MLLGANPNLLAEHHPAKPEVEDARMARPLMLFTLMHLGPCKPHLLYGDVGDYPHTEVRKGDQHRVKLAIEVQEKG